MRKMTLVLLCLMSTAGCAQTAKEAAAALEASMTNRELVLRNFSGEEKVRAKWDGNTLELEAPRWRTMGALAIESLKLKGDMLVMRCARHVALRDAAGKVVLYDQPSEVEVDVDLGGADPAVVLPQLKAWLFYPSIAEAVTAIPPDVQRWVPARVDEKIPEPKKRSRDANPACDCAASDRTGCGPLEASAGMVAPKVVSMNEPEFTNSARRAELNGDVTVRFTVDQAGHPGDLWVVRPAGLGLDEAAAASVLKDRFKPAMCHAVPVSAALMTVVNFRIYRR